MKFPRIVQQTGFRVDIRQIPPEGPAPEQVCGMSKLCASSFEPELQALLTSFM